MTRRSPHRVDHAAAVDRARGERGTWIPAAIYPTSDSANEMVKRILRGHSVLYGPAGEFEAYPAMHDQGYALWVRYVAGDAPVPELPETMTVRVADRGQGTEYVGVRIAELTISALCPRCGGPRGVETLRAERLVEDGEFYSVSRWENPCGHRDQYADVLRESVERPAGLARQPRPQARDPFDPGRGPYAGAVAVVLAAAQQSRAMHARQAAQLLEDRGHTAAAELVRTALRERGGHMSAKQAAQMLRDIRPGQDTTVRTSADD